MLYLAEAAVKEKSIGDAVATATNGAEAGASPISDTKHDEIGRLSVTAVCGANVNCKLWRTCNQRSNSLCGLNAMDFFNCFPV